MLLCDILLYTGCVEQTDRQTDRQRETYRNGALFDSSVEGDGYGDTPATV